MRFLERFSLAALLGVLWGAVLATVDVFRRLESVMPVDLLTASAYAVVPSSVAFVALFICITIALSLTPIRLDRRQWIGLLAGVFVVSLAAGFVLCVSRNYRDWTGLGVVLASLPIAALSYAYVPRVKSLQLAGRPFVYGLAALVTLCIGAGGVASAGAWSWPYILLPVPGFLALLCGLGLTVWSSHRPAVGGAAAAAVLAIGAATLVVFGQPGSSTPPRRDVPTAAARPNVVLLVLDTTRRDRLGCYGYGGGLTPELDRIAAQGAVYEQAFAPAPWTVPSHASMFTGLYPKTHGCSDEHHKWLDDELVTLAEALRASDYQTIALYSNSFLGTTNQMQGFDAAVRTIANYDYEPLMVFDAAYRLGLPTAWVNKGGEPVLRELNQWLGSDYAPSRPFFLFINLLEAHNPYVAPYRDRLACLPPDLGYLDSAKLVLKFDMYENHFRGESSAKVCRVMSAMYDAEIRYQDQVVGRIVRALEQCAALDDTLLIIVADHGENLGDGGRWGHQHAVNDTLIHVPLIVRYPKLFPAGARIPGFCSLVDLFPTVFDVLATDCPVPNLPGRSLTPRRFAPRQEAFAELSPYYPDFELMERTLGFELGARDYRGAKRVIRTDQFKYVWSSDGRHRLYDLTKDPAETTNQIESMSQVALELHGRLTALWDSLPAYEPPRRSVEARPLDDETVRRLGALGYVDVKK